MTTLWAVFILVSLVVMLGQWSPKVAYTLAVLILLGTVLLNVDQFEKIVKGEFK